MRATAFAVPRLRERRFHRLRTASSERPGMRAAMTVHFFPTSATEAMIIASSSSLQKLGPVVFGAVSVARPSRWAGRRLHPERCFQRLRTLSSERPGMRAAMMVHFSPTSATEAMMIASSSSLHSKRRGLLGTLSTTPAPPLLPPSLLEAGCCVADERAAATGAAATVDDAQVLALLVPQLSPSPRRSGALGWRRGRDEEGTLGRR